MMGEFGELVNVGVHAAHEAFELGEDFGDVGGNFGERARKDVEVVVAVHFELAELEEIVRGDRRHGGEISAERIHLRRLAAGHEGRTQAVEFVLVLEF